MPGHKGRGPIGVENRDITEIPGAGVLYTEQLPACHSEERSDEESSFNRDQILRCAHNDMTDCIAESEQNAALLFGSVKTLYSTEGSSLCIRAMLYLARLHAVRQGRKPVILAGRNAHKSFLTAAALLDLEIEWLLPEGGTVLSCEIAPEDLEKQLEHMDEPPTAVYITSPDYLGNIADLPALSEVCHRCGCLLLVDNAHGAYLRFLPEDRHPMALGADLCCDSAHKTLPVLTGGAYLHLAKSCPAALREAAESAMGLFASTSPSYLILQSLDACNARLSEAFPDRLRSFLMQVGALMDRLKEYGYSLTGDEPLKLTIDARAFGYEGTELAAMLRQSKVECEFADPDFLVLMLSPETGADGLHKIETALCGIQRRPRIPTRPPTLPTPDQAIRPREALLGMSELLETERCLGRILAQPSVGCPPAVPIAVCGERLHAAHLELFRYYGIDKLRVLR